MITSIFNKSRPINYILVFFILLLAFLISVFKYFEETFSWYNVVHLFFNFLLVLITVFALNFIVTKNILTKDNTFALFIVSIYILLVPQVFFSTKLLLSNLFILLAIRRLVSLSSQKNTIKKLVDSGILIALASVFYIWSVWFLILPIIAVYLHSENRINYWLIPFIGALSVGVISFAIYLLNPIWFNTNISMEGLNYDFTNYNSLQIITALTLIFGLGVWFSFSYVPSIKKRKRIKWPAYKLVFFYLCISVIVFFFKADKVISEFVMMSVPFAIVAANYFQKTSDKWFKNGLLILWLILATYLVFV
jgi:hypothetical protein